MKKKELNTLIRKLDTKIVDALITLGLKPSRVLDLEMQIKECHFITPNFLINNYSPLIFTGSPLSQESICEIESSQLRTFYFITGKNSYPYQKKGIYLYSLN